MGKDYHFKMPGEELQSKTIDFLRFPLIVGVVFIHTNFADIVIPGAKQFSLAHYPVFSHIFFLFSNIIFEVCVPLFFFISGFLFFYKTTDFSKAVYLQKLKNRLSSLLIPYVFWNLLVLLFLLLAQTFLSGSLVSGRNKLIMDYSVMDWLWSFWDTSQINPHFNKSLPINTPFWFIRDLMVLVVCSPLIYFLIKKIGVYAVIALGLLWFFNPYVYKPGFSTVSLFFFSAGAYFSMHKINFAEVMEPMLKAVAPLYILIIILAFYFVGSGWWPYLYCAAIVMGLITTVALCAHYLAKDSWHTNSFLANGSFFIFAFHRLPLVFVIKFLFKVLRPQSEGLLLFLYLACPAIIIVFGLIGYSVLKQVRPRFTAAVSGGR